MKYFFYFLLLFNLTATAQLIPSRKLGKSPASLNAGIAGEGHETSFSKLLLIQTNQFIELTGGSGIFSPNYSETETYSGGLTLNKGKQNHYLSFGIHFTYASDEPLETFQDLKRIHFSPKTLVGYNYSNKKVNFKFQLQPQATLFIKNTPILKRTLSGIGSIASLSIKLPS